MSEKSYVGYRTMQKGHEGDAVNAGCNVDVINRDGTRHPLNPHYDVRNHSPCGFEWGYQGSGPAQLALALCLDATQDRRRAEYVYQAFKRAVVCRLPRDGWILLFDYVLSQIEIIEGAELVGELPDQAGEE